MTIFPLFSVPGKQIISQSLDQTQRASIVSIWRIQIRALERNVARAFVINAFSLDFHFVVSPLDAQRRRRRRKKNKWRCKRNFTKKSSKCEIQSFSPTKTQIREMSRGVKSYRFVSFPARHDYALAIVSSGNGLETLSILFLNRELIQSNSSRTPPRAIVILA